ncbi:MAG: IclR family transcriptional regulator [Chloroflexota bacterium]
MGIAINGGRPYNAQSLDRGLLALALLRDSPQGELGLTELALGVGVHKSTLHRLLTTLMRHGYIAQDPTTKRYRLGLAFLEFAHHAVERLDVRRQALRVMHQLAAQSGESVYLNVRSGARVLSVDEVVGPTGVTLGSNVGVALPLHATAAGKCFLAWMPETERAALLGAGRLQRVTERTITSPDRLLAELERVRRRGFATNEEETEPGVRYAAAPVFGLDGAIVAALVLGAPILRVSAADFARLGPAVGTAAARVSAALGFRESLPAPAQVPVTGS